MLLEHAEKYSEEIRTAGARAAAALLRAGIAIYYMDDAVCAGIIKEFPDGRRQEIRLGPGREDIVIRELPPITPRVTTVY